MSKPRIRASFSGGRTSGLMMHFLHEMLGDTHEIVTTFANTGCEHEGTLEFVNRCDTHFGWGVVWLEARFHADGEGTTSQVVTYSTASRNGEPFEAYIAKYGIPNMTSKNCTSRLKECPMDHYTHKVLGWERLSYDTAIGIRADEFDRMSSRHKELRLIYPLVDLRITKADVLAFWKSQPFDLEIPGEHYGNCMWCWKKSKRKLLTLAKNSPEVFDFPARMEREFGTVKAGPDYKATGPDGRRHFFRGHLDTADLIAEAQQGGFVEFDGSQTAYPLFDHLMDTGSGCGDSCEIGADE